MKTKDERKQAAGEYLQRLFALHGGRVLSVTVRRRRDRNGNFRRFVRLFAGQCEEITEDASQVLGVRLAAGGQGVSGCISIATDTPRDLVERLSMALYFDSARLKAEVR